MPQLGADRASQGITSRQESYIFHIPFNFNAVAHGTQQTYRVAVNQGDMLIHGMTTWNTETDPENVKLYWIKLLNREYNQSLMSDFVSGIGILETDARNLFRFSSPWYVRKGTYLDMTLRNPSDAELGTDYGVSYTVTTQQVLIAQVFPRGLPAPKKQPFMLSMWAPLGFQEDTTSGGNVLDSANIYPSYQAALDPLLWDFELTTICMDTGMINYSQDANVHTVQVIERNTKRTLINGPASQANQAGSRVLAAMDAYQGGTIPAGLPQTNALVHNLPVPVMCKKGSQLTAKLGFNLNYSMSTNSVISNLNQVCNIVLMGNKFEETGRFSGSGAFNNIRNV